MNEFGGADATAVDAVMPGTGEGSWRYRAAGPRMPMALSRQRSHSLMCAAWQLDDPRAGVFLADVHAAHAGDLVIDESSLR